MQRTRLFPTTNTNFVSFFFNLQILSYDLNIKLQERKTVVNTSSQTILTELTDRRSLNKVVLLRCKFTQTRSISKYTGNTRLAIFSQHFYSSMFIHGLYVNFKDIIHTGVTFYFHSTYCSNVCCFSDQKTTTE